MSDLGRPWTYASGCTVCGKRDERALTTTRLADGELAVVCGTHRLMHDRSPRVATTISDLRAMLRDRRLGRERRVRGDELGGELESAFGPDNRAAERRRN